MSAAGAFFDNAEVCNVFLNISFVSIFTGLVDITELYFPASKHFRILNLPKPKSSRELVNTELLNVSPPLIPWITFLDQIWAILYDPEEVLGKINDKLYLH